MIRLLVAMGLAALSIVGGATGSSASEPAGYLLVSHDGENYTAGSDLGLFSNAGLVVPSDNITDEVWIKNGASEAGRVRIDITNPHATDPAIASAVTVAVTPGNGGITMADALAQGTCTVLSTDLVLQPGEVVKLSATVAVDPELGSSAGDEGSEGQNESVGFQLRGIMIDAKVPATALPGDVCALTPEPVPSPRPSDLPATGAPFDLTSLLVACCAVAGGFVLAFLPRRRKAIADE